MNFSLSANMAGFCSDSHKYIFNRARSELYHINRLSRVSSKILHLLYQVYIIYVSIIDYCDVVWTPSGTVLTWSLLREFT